MKYSGRKYSNIGLPPGSLKFVGDKKTEKIQIDFYKYNEHSYSEKKNIDVKKLELTPGTEFVNWYNIVGLHDEKAIEVIGDFFKIHILTLEDILNTECYPKIEFFNNYIFLELRLLSFSKSKDDIISEQISIILGKNFVISFLERPSDIFNSIIERISKKGSRISALGTDFLFYSLLDNIIDNYFMLLDSFDDSIEEIEIQAFKNPDKIILQSIHLQKRNFIYLRKSIWPLREVIRKLETDIGNLISEQLTAYIRDLYDHTVQLIETIETMRDILSASQDIYLSGLSNRMNEVMKVLTIIGTIFLPLTFIAGVYGMNFKYMPELGWSWGYPLILILMLSIGIFMIFYFKKRKWF
jgi:magnesium transporter